MSNLPMSLVTSSSKKPVEWTAADGASREMEPFLSVSMQPKISSGFCHCSVAGSLRSRGGGERPTKVKGRASECRGHDYHVHVARPG